MDCTFSHIVIHAETTMPYIWPIHAREESGETRGSVLRGCPALEHVFTLQFVSTTTSNSTRLVNGEPAFLSVKTMG
jgi:hypothetical protein